METSDPMTSLHVLQNWTNALHDRAGIFFGYLPPSVVSAFPYPSPPSLPIVYATMLLRTPPSMGRAAWSVRPKCIIAFPGAQSAVYRVPSFNDSQKYKEDPVQIIAVSRLMLKEIMDVRVMANGFVTTCLILDRKGKYIRIVRGNDGIGEEEPANWSNIGVNQDIPVKGLEVWRRPLTHTSGINHEALAVQDNSKGWTDRNARCCRRIKPLADDGDLSKSKKIESCKLQERLLQRVPSRPTLEQQPFQNCRIRHSPKYHPTHFAAWGGFKTRQVWVMIDILVLFATPSKLAPRACHFDSKCSEPKDHVARFRLELVAGVRVPYPTQV